MTWYVLDDTREKSVLNWDRTIYSERALYAPIRLGIVSTIMDTAPNSIKFRQDFAQTNFFFIEKIELLYWTFKMIQKWEKKTHTHKNIWSQTMSQSIIMILINERMK